MSIIKLFICMAILFFAPFNVFAENKEGMDEPDINLKILPFSEVIDWRYEENRRDYKNILKKSGYTLEFYEIRFINGSGGETSMWHEKETISIIKKRGNVVGSVWTAVKSRLPSLIYKLENRKFYEPPLIYSRVNRYEVIQDHNNNMLSLSYYDLGGLSWLQKSLAKCKYDASIKKEELPRDYLRSNSLNEFLDYAEKHRQEILAIIDSENENSSPIEIYDMGEEKYEEIRGMIKKEVKKYGGDNWKGKWLDIQKKWPAMKKEIE